VLPAVLVVIGLLCVALAPQVGKVLGVALVLVGLAAVLRSPD